jgi:serine/threonine protein kinase
MKDTQAETLIDTRYRLIREIARGGAGTVYEAKHEFTGRPVALKLLRPDQANVPESQARLLREARALYLARHPNVIEVLDAGLARSGQVYLATELYEGRTLSGLLAARGMLSVADTIQICLQVAAALQAVHGQGLIHRDVKPDNLLLQRDEKRGVWRVKLVDFGAARLNVNDVKLTQAGQILGTPEYMSPEQLMGEELDHRADIYALGITLYECLTGSVPFPGNFAQVLLGVSSGTYPPLKQASPDVPDALEALVARAISTRPQARFHDVTSMARELTRCAPNPQHEAPATKARVEEEFAKRRAYARASYITPVRLLTQAGPSDGRSEDISQGGVLVLLENELASGQTVRLRFALPITGKIVEVDALAKWTRAQRGRRVTGLEFVKLPPEASEAVARYIKLMAAPQR